MSPLYLYVCFFISLFINCVVVVMNLYVFLCLLSAFDSVAVTIVGIH